MFRKLPWQDPRIEQVWEEVARLKGRLPSEVWANVVLVSLEVLLLDLPREDWNPLWQNIRSEAEKLDELIDRVFANM